MKKMKEVEQDGFDRPVTIKITKPAIMARAKKAPLAQQMVGGSSVAFPYSYKPSRFEGRWLVESLGSFYDEHWFDDVTRMIKGGKEASVYLCQGNLTTGKHWLAAKVYRPRMYRNLKDDHIYREGRQQLDESGLELHDERADRAMAKRTKYGLNLMHVDWIQHEFEAMRLLHERGGALPKPYVCANNAILMDYIGDEDQPAPPLVSVDLDSSLARKLFEKTLSNITLMLSCNLVHGDFSAYNLLFWQNDIWMIDFPQAFDPRRNRNAWVIFQRDMNRICQYFEKQGVHANAKQLAESQWKKAGLDVQRVEDTLALERSLEE